MASPVYTNKSLERFQRANPDTIVEDIYYTPEERAKLIGEYTPDPDRDMILAQAKAALQRANETGLRIGRERGAYEQQEQIPLKPGAVARGVVELLNPLGGGFELGPQATQAERFGAATLPYLTSGTVRAARLLGRGSLKALQSALTPREAIDASRAARTFGRGVGQAQGMKVSALSKEIPSSFASRQIAENPEQILSVAREVAAELGVPVSQVLARSKAYPQSRLAALRGLEETGRRTARRTSRTLPPVSPLAEELFPGNAPGEDRAIQGLLKLFNESPFFGLLTRQR